MGHKYAIPSVLTHALSRLKRYYTSDFKVWNDPAERARYVDASPLDAMCVIQLALLTDTPSLLPTAYLICCDVLDYTYTSPDEVAGQLVIRDFPDQNLLCVMSGHTQLLQAAAARVLPLVSAIATGTCPCPSRCALHGISLLRSRHLDRSVFKKLNHDGALGPLDAWFLEHPTGRLCSACDANVRHVDVLCRARVWSRLPDAFGLTLTQDEWPSKKANAGQA